MELRLRAGFEPEIVTLSVADNFLYDRAHLVDLHREDDEVLGLIVVFLGSLAEALVRLLNPVVENIREAQQYGSGDMACGQLVDNVLQIDLHAILLRGHINMALLVNTKVIDSPAFDVVELFGVFNAPFLHDCQLLYSSFFL